MAIGRLGDSVARKLCRATHRAGGEDAAHFHTLFIYKTFDVELIRLGNCNRNGKLLLL